MLTTDQISSALIFFAVTYPIIGFLFRDSTCGTAVKRRNLFYAFGLIGILSAVKIFYDSSNISSNYYSILQVGRHSNTLDIRRSYKQLSKEYHPDKNFNNEEANIHFQQIKEAYDILMDETSRDLYNRYGALPSYSFDPRKDELRLISDTSLAYLFWAVVVYIMTLPVSSRSCRTWLLILGINLSIVFQAKLVTQHVYICLFHARRDSNLRGRGCLPAV